MAKSIQIIKEELSVLDLKEQIAYLESLKDDTRGGVVKLVEKVKRDVEKQIVELKRLETLTLYEKKLIHKGFQKIAGIDEVGRGPLAGPVVACAVVLNRYDLYEHINDSKKVSKKNREILFQKISDTAEDVAFGMASPEEIDELNILNATKLAMKRAIENLKEKPDHLLIDAVKLDDISIEQTNIIKGDEKSMTIAAASIMAKVTRDAMMEELGRAYPEYDFENNKGYGTASHYKGLNAVGISPIHRRSFVKDFL
ncbi:MAG: ribonuclease HII [Clostridia bacterium]|nr:ribonuclease HII [Clostridia bacterium]